MKSIRDYNFERRSYEGRTGDAWAFVGEEGRGKLRKFAGIRKRETIRKCPNGGTRQAEGLTHGASHEHYAGN